MSQSVEFALREVPQSQRRGLYSISLVLLSFTFFTGTMFAGGKLGLSFRFIDMLWIAFIGNALLAIYAAVLAFISCRSGLNAVLLGRFCFGQVGSRLSDMILGGAELGWYAWGTAALAISLCGLWGWPDWVKYLLMIGLGFGFCTTALMGVNGLNLLSFFSVPLMLVLLIISIVKATYHVGGWESLITIMPEHSMSWSTAITVVFGSFASGATQATNWTRLSRSGKAAVTSSFFSFFIGNGVMIIAGGWCAIVYQQTDIVTVMILQGLSFMAIVMLCINLWNVQGPTLYNVSAAACHLIRTDPRQATTLICAAIGILLAVSGISDMLVPFLGLLGALIPPIGGVIMADFWFVHRGHYPPLDETSLPNFNLRGVLAYVIGALIACGSPWIAPVVGIIASAVAYIALECCRKSSWNGCRP